MAADPRCVSILCSRFLEAPGQSTNLLIGHLMETGSVRAIEERALLLVLDRNEEARAMRDDETGRDVENVEEGHFLKKLQIEDALLKNGVRQLPIAFFNTLEYDPKILNEAIWSRLLQMRERQAICLDSLSQAIDAMIRNREHENALAAQREVNRRIEIFIEQNAELRDMIRHCQQSLLDQMSRTHARTLWASMRRAGSWPNFDVYFWLGTGASQDAMLRSLPSVLGADRIDQQYTEISVAARMRDQEPAPINDEWKRIHVFLPTGEPCPYDLLVSGAFGSNLSRQEIRVER
ncbi:MAG TPA: hypothetical protein VNE82_06480 [Candidatus Binataceae bacterium]|nr:hypothetical protein [Candidatus Binataceae bacterium]